MPSNDGVEALQARFVGQRGQSVQGIVITPSLERVVHAPPKGEENDSRRTILHSFIICLALRRHHPPFFFVCVPRIVGIPFGFSISPEQARSEAYVLIPPICSACLNGHS